MRWGAGHFLSASAQCSTVLQHTPQHTILFHKVMQQSNTRMTQHQNKQRPSDQRVRTAKRGQPAYFSATTSNQTEPKRVPAITITDHDHQAGNRQQKHSEVEQSVTGFDQKRSARLLLWAIILLRSGLDQT